MNTQQRNMLMVGVVVVVLVIVGFIATRKSDDTVSTKKSESTLPRSQTIPTVDASVIVSLKADAKKQNAILSVSDAPEGTTSIYYEFSYDALVDGETVSRGVVGDLEVGSDNSAEGSITIGTCSSGTCKYDKGVTSVHLLLRFSGSYGEKGFEKDFAL